MSEGLWKMKNKNNMFVYAIRLKNTKKYLPAYWEDRINKRITRGFSNTEPTDKVPPRLHFTKKAAENALTAWLQGVWEPKSSTNSYGEYDYDCGPMTIKGRIKEDMEIVCFKLKEVIIKSK